MSALILPQARVPLAWVKIPGVEKPVAALIDIEWMRAFSVLVTRVGGAVAPDIDIDGLLARVGAKPVFIDDVGEQGDTWPTPGPQGIQGPPGAMVPGEDGAAGEPGLMFFAPAPFRAPADVTASRALNTTYTNVSTATLLVHATVRCAVTLAGGTADVQAKSDTSSPPTTAATGVVGIEAGLLGEDNSFQVVFLVNPGAKYRLDSTAANGTVTLSNWVEFTL